jgi:hypothetical protein
VLLFKLWSRRRGAMTGWTAAATYAWALTPILVSSYHGNTDSVAAAAWLLSVYLATEHGADFAAGLALAAAINVKLIPLLGIPAAFAYYRSWKRATRFFDGLALGLLPFLPVVVVVGPAFYRNAIAYGSSVWGARSRPSASRWANRSSSSQSWQLRHGQGGIRRSIRMRWPPWRPPSSSH